MAKARSPGYPAIGLKEAIERVRMVYDNDYQNKLPKAIIAEHMGYKGLSGTSLTILSSLTKYGLLEGRGDETQVSDLALSIIAHPPGSPERVDALRGAAAKPELFVELDSRFQGGRASDTAIRSYLLTQKFIPEAADAAVRAYRETKQLVEAEAEGYNYSESKVPAESRNVLASENAKSAVTLSPENVNDAFKDVDLTKKNTWQILHDGDSLHIRGLVDRRGLGKLIKTLTGYKAVLEAAADDDAEEAE